MPAKFDPVRLERHVSTRITSEDWKEIQQLAKKEDRFPCAMLRKLIVDGLRRRGVRD